MTLDERYYMSTFKFVLLVAISGGGLFLSLKTVMNRFIICSL